MLPELGAACIFAAFAACIYAAFAALRGRNGDRRWVVSARRGIYAFAGLMILAVVMLEISFLRDDFSVALVAGHSSRETPLGYKLTAMWSSQAGSLLLWAFVLSIASSLVLRLTRNKHREILPYATAILAGLGAFFTGLMLFGVVSPAAESFPVHRPDAGAGRRGRPQPAAPPPGDGDPPADALPPATCSSRSRSRLRSER